MGAGIRNEDDSLGRSNHVPLCQSFNFRFGHRREVCIFGSDDLSRNVGMMGLQVFFQEVGRCFFQWRDR